MINDIKPSWKSYLWILFLLAANGILWLYSMQQNKTQRGSFDIFAMEDTASIQSIEFETSRDSWAMNRETNWDIDSVASDLQLRTILFTLLKKVRVQRQLSEIEAREISNYMQPINISIYGKTSKSEIAVYWNPIRSRTFFGKGENLYEVEIPGYKDFLGAIFDLKKNQWRDRFLMNNNARSIQKLQLVGGEIDLKIEFNGSFFTVNQVEILDSLIVTDYLNSFSAIYLDGWVEPSQNAIWDSVAVMDKSWRLTIEDIYNKNPRVFTIIKNPQNSTSYILKTHDGNFGIIRKELVDKWLKSYSAFELKRQ